MNYKPYLRSLPILLITLFFCCLPWLYAEDLGPADKLKKILADTKRTGNLSAIVENYNWDIIYQKYKSKRNMLPSKVKAAADDFTSLEDFKKFVIAMAKNPSSVAREKIQSYLKNPKLTPQDKELFTRISESVLEHIEESQEDLESRLKKMTFSVGLAKTDGISSTVPLTIFTNDQELKEEIFMIQKDNKWLIVNVPEILRPKIELPSLNLTSLN